MPSEGGRDDRADHCRNVRLAAAGAGGEPVSITWHGSPWSLAGLGLLNTMLTILTLGIYSFWGRTEARRRIWSMVRMNGEPFAYTGTGKELFLGYIIVFLIITVPTILAFSVIPYVAIYLLGPVAGPIVGAIFVVWPTWSSSIFSSAPPCIGPCATA